jgi:hypothetical protein
MNIHKLLIGLGAAAALMIAAPMAMASGEVIISGPSYFMHYYDSDSALCRDRLLMQRGFEPYPSYDRRFSRRHFGYYQDRRVGRFRPYGPRTYPSYRDRSRPSFGFYYRY